MSPPSKALQKTSSLVNVSTPVLTTTLNTPKGTGTQSEHDVLVNNVANASTSTAFLNAARKLLILEFNLLNVLEISRVAEQTGWNSKKKGDVSTFLRRLHKAKETLEQGNISDLKRQILAATIFSKKR